MLYGNCFAWSLQKDEKGKIKMLRLSNGDFVHIAGAFLSDDMDITCNRLEQYGITVKNEDGTYKAFNEVMEQIYSLHVHEGE
jgi:peroxiredoxin